MTDKFFTTYRANSEVKTLSSSGKKHIVLLTGGMSAEREVSLSSAKGVGKALVENGYKVTEVDKGSDLAVVLHDLKPDIVFNCLHGTFGEDGSVPGLLNIMHIPYTHSGLLSSAICFNKQRTREVLISNGIQCTPGIILNKSENIKSDPLPRPYVIKPLAQGSSVGIHVIFNEDQFDFAEYNFKYGDKILVEKYIKGRELQVAMLNGEVLGVMELKLLKNRFYDYETKYTDGFAEHLLPAPISNEVEHQLKSISEKIYQLLDCRGMVRVEAIYDEVNNELYILEVNTHPGMTPQSICPEIAAYHGISFNQLVEELLIQAQYDKD